MKKLPKCMILLLIGTCFLFSACDKQSSTTYIDPEKKASNTDNLPEKTTARGIRLGIGSIITPKEGYIYYRHLVEYLEAQLTMPVSVTDRGTYEEFNELLAAGDLDVAFVCGGPYVEGKEAFDLSLLVVPETLTGETVYYSDLIVPADSTARRLEDLRGKRFAFTDPQSNSGKLVPTYLLAQAGEKPETFFGEIIYTYAHDKSIQAVAEKTVDGASVDSLIYEYMIKKDPTLTSKAKRLTRSAPYGMPPVVVRPDISADLREKLLKILLEMDKNPEGFAILQGMNIRRFVENSDSDYDSIREIREFTREHSRK